MVQKSGQYKHVYIQKFHPYPIPGFLPFIHNYFYFLVIFSMFIKYKQVWIHIYYIYIIFPVSYANCHPIYAAVYLSSSSIGYFFETKPYWSLLLIGCSWHPLSAPRSCCTTQQTLWRGCPWSWVAMPLSSSSTVPTWTRLSPGPWPPNSGTLDRWVLEHFSGLCALQRSYPLPHLLGERALLGSFLHSSCVSSFIGCLVSALSLSGTLLGSEGMKGNKVSSSLASRKFSWTADAF